MGQNSWRSDYLINSIIGPLTTIGQSALNKASANPKFTAIPQPNFVSIIFGACSSFFMLTRLIEHQYDVKTFDHEHIEKHADLVNQIIFDSFDWLKISIFNNSDVFQFRRLNIKGIFAACPISITL